MTRRTRMRTIPEARAAYLAQWKAEGGQTAFYFCPGCEGPIETPAPKEGDRQVFSGGKICPHCSNIHWTAVRHGAPVRVLQLVTVAGAQAALAELTGGKPCAL